MHKHFEQSQFINSPELFPTTYIVYIFRLSSVDLALTHLSPDWLDALHEEVFYLVILKFCWHFFSLFYYAKIDSRVLSYLGLSLTADFARAYAYRHVRFSRLRSTVFLIQWLKFIFCVACMTLGDFTFVRLSLQYLYFF